MTSGFLAKMRVANGHAVAVQAALDTAFGRDKAIVQDIVKASDDAVVLSGEFDGMPVIFKKFLTENAPRLVKAQKREVSYLETHLGHGKFRVNPCLATLPDDGVVVLGSVPGERVSRILKTADAPRRAKVLALSGGWLAACAALRHEVKPLDANRILASLDPLVRRPLERGDNDLISHMITDLTQQTSVLHGLSAKRAIAHSDFAPVNLHCDDDTIYAIDIQRAHWFPLARIAARFLVAKDFYYDHSAPRRFGLHADDLKAFDPCGDIATPDGPAMFRFFVGEQLARRFVSTYVNDAKTPFARQCLLAYLDQKDIS